MTLSDDDIRQIGACLDAVANGPFIPDWEFPTLMGVTRDECRSVATQWPAVDFNRDDVRLSVLNGLNNLTGYPIDEQERWSEFVPVSREALDGLYHRFKASLPPK